MGTGDTVSRSVANPSTALWGDMDQKPLTLDGVR